ncbi:MAG: helix-turn-helix domain-containing protein [Myxococcales bacterium]
MSERSYGDPCGIARALDLVGERWALLVVRELVHGPRRFKDLRTGLAGASPNVLSQRLDELEAGGVVQRVEGSYELTAWGKELHPVLLSLGSWGARSPVKPAGKLSLNAFLVALESTFDASAAQGLSARYELKLSGVRCSVEVERERVHVALGAPSRADALIEGEVNELRAVVFGDRKLADSSLTLQGDRALGKAFVRLFKRPPRASSP